MIDTARVEEMGSELNQRDEDFPGLFIRQVNPSNLQNRRDKTQRNAGPGINEYN